MDVGAWVPYNPLDDFVIVATSLKFQEYDVGSRGKFFHGMDASITLTRFSADEFAHCRFLSRFCD